MDIDWEVEIGGGAPVIEAEWAGFVDLHEDPRGVSKIPEAVSFPPLGNLLSAINADNSPWWTSKCDFWQPEPLTSACYVDVLPRATSVFANWQEAEKVCRACVACMNQSATVALKQSMSLGAHDPPQSRDVPEISINLVVRAAIAREQEGFGITAYMSGKAAGAEDSYAALACAMDIITNALLGSSGPQDLSSTLK